MSASASPIIDLRSDTVTKPTDEMRKAMFESVVGDDVFNDDPTVHELQNAAAKLLGKEAGLYVASGTMGNLICCLVHCNTRDSEMILGSDSHIHLYEGGGSAVLGGIHSRTVTNKPDGTMDLAEIESKIRGLDDHYPTTKLICLENTHNRCCGAFLPTSYVDEVGSLARKHGLRLHIDGARLVNAHAANPLKETPARMVQAADSVSLCLSKGLGAPIGSVIVGTTEFIRQARRIRKMLGGGMRQAGTIAAAGLVALNKMWSRVGEDHENARLLANELATIKGINIDLNRVQSNLVFFDLDVSITGLNGHQIKSEMAKDNILVGAITESRMRFVLHHQVTKEHIPLVIAKLKSVLKQ